MNLRFAAQGMLEVELTSADPEQTLSAAMDSGMRLVGVRKKNPLTVTFQISCKTFSSLEQLCERRGDSLRIKGRVGLYWTWIQLLQRPVLLIGLAILFVTVVFLPTRVLFVKVEGNVRVPKKQILDAAGECGVKFGSNRRAVRSEKVKNHLLSDIPQLQWAGINTSGCTATISVRERSDDVTEVEKYPVASIVAERDGYILSGTVTSGTALFRVGQTVEAGQVLVSGHTDCGTYIQVTRADGEIFAQTRREIRSILPGKWSIKEAKMETKKVYSIRIGKKRINLWKDSGNPLPSCGRMYTEYCVTLAGGLRLPIALCVDEFTYYKTAVYMISQTEAEHTLDVLTEDYLLSLMVAGEITAALGAVSYRGDVFVLQGEYICSEMIGRVRSEQIGETNGENS